MEIDEETYLEHYGILRKSGRYPWGSGGNQSARNRGFLDYVDELRKQGLSDVEICAGLNIGVDKKDGHISTTSLRAARSIAKNEQKQSQISQAQRLKDRGWGSTAIGKRLGIPESQVRALLAPGEADKAQILNSTAAMLKDQVQQHRLVDIGSGVEHHVNVSSTRLNNAVALLREEGYEVHTIDVTQLGTGKKTKTKVLAPPGTTWGEVVKNRADIRVPNVKSEDGGRSFLGLLPPMQISQDRISIRYKEDGGSNADGVIYVRPGVKDLSLDGSRYAQVRIAVEGTHYLKGMAMYKTDLPDGVDLQFNTNKSLEKTGPNKLDAMKKITDDPDNPFGAVVTQIGPRNEKGQITAVTSAMNLVNREGDWSQWSKSLSSQMLSKQSSALAKRQLDMTYEARINEYNRISALTNPTIKKKLLETFGDEADAAAVHLKAAHLPRQGSHVILPIESMRPDQVYAPNFENGERVVLIRYPHGGTFEIPELTVNNRHPEAKELLGPNRKEGKLGARDAIGIHPAVAERLSGADFDGDTVLVIPNNSRKVKTTPALEGLKDFDPKSAYPAYEGMPKMTPKMKQTQMGVVSNLITDMTIHKASEDEMARAIRHSMVVIDAEKWDLNYKESARVNGIAALKEKYQSDSEGRGASTLISRAGSRVEVPARKDRPAAQGGSINKQTGEREYVVDTARKPYTNAKGQLVVPTTRSEKLAETKDAFTLVSGVSGTPIERVYAEHSNKLKALANKARKESVETPSGLTTSTAAKQTYAPEVARLKAALHLAERNAPLERSAQLLAGVKVKATMNSQPDMDSTQVKRLKSQALNEARNRVGAKKDKIVISPREWEAIQAGAISPSALRDIVTHTDLDQIKEYATPSIKRLMTPAVTARAQEMLNDGYTRAEVASHLGVSVSTLDQVTDVQV